MICLIHAHPYHSHSHANRALLEAVRPVFGMEIRPLYDLYPDFDIDIESEQQALSRAGLIVWQHPMYWYSAPGLLKHWFDKVLAPGWAYGGGQALRGKRCLWVCTTGGDDAAYAAGGAHGQPFVDFIAPLEATARFCGMSWCPPFIVHGAEALDAAALAAHGARLRAVIEGHAGDGEAS